WASPSCVGVARYEVGVRSVQGTRGCWKRRRRRSFSSPSRFALRCSHLADRSTAWYCPNELSSRSSAASADLVRRRLSTIVYVGENLESTANSPEIAAS